MIPSAALDVESSPPLALPMRLFLCGALAANMPLGLLAYAAFSGMQAAAAMVVLATHWMALGVLFPIMVGALLQMLPVVAGVQVPLLVWFRCWFPPLLYAGLGCMSLVFSGLAISNGFFWNAVLLSVAIIPSGVLLLRAVLGSQVKEVTTRGIQGALSLLLIAVLLGGLMLFAFAGIPWVDVMTTLSRHIRFATVGWMALLVMSTAQNVVPMFQLTPGYPALLKTWLTPWVIAWCLLGWIPALQLLSNGMLALTLMMFAGFTLWLQQKSKRPKEATVRFWKLGMWSLAVVSGGWLCAEVVPVNWPWDMQVLLGAVFFVGAIFSVIIGMLYKIVAFLVWWHLQKLAGPKLTLQVPNMRQVFPSKATNLHFLCHAMGVAGLVLSVLLSPWWPVLSALLLLPLMVANGMLAQNLLNAWSLHQLTCSKLRALLRELSGAN